MADMTPSKQSKTCKYRVRWFYSKGAFLVLVWTFLINFVSFSQLLHYTDLGDSIMQTLFYTTPWICLIATPISGWLADAKFGMYKVLKAGLVLVYIGSVFHCVLALVRERLNETVGIVCLYIILIVVFLGYSAFLCTSAQLGLDQMPDASSQNISCFLAWYIFSLLAGMWLSYLLRNAQNGCNLLSSSTFVQISSFVPVFCMSFILISDFLLGPKWLITEPNSPQSLKIIYLILKFAAKHKAPLYRSAFTYWEEDIPSRLDLGKSKYGGPFTTEQVEDVKTALRIVVVSIIVWTGYFFIQLSPTGYIDISTLTRCESVFVNFFGYSYQWCYFLGLFLQEFVLYPITRGKLNTSTLKRIEASFFLVTLGFAVCLVLIILQYESIVTIGWIVRGTLSILNALVYLVYVTSIVEFIYAQSPYNMRGLFVGTTFSLYAVSSLSATCILDPFLRWCMPQESCPTFYWSTVTIMTLLNFLLYCTVARWYKRRVRDDGFSPQTVVEEVYDRYLTAASVRQNRYLQINKQ